ncbi:hypothetical protein [Nocardia sp. NPDC051463]|uniref:hypothetical protein n=1 Tax=Nocardia sp. NPDC051463 TaxID=3154845 RepID=UPI00344F7C8E
MKITPISGSLAAADVAADLRALADLAESDGDGFVAALLARLLNHDVFPCHAAGHEHKEQRAEVMAEAIRRLKAVASGPIKKDYNESGAGYFDATVPMRGISIVLTDLRAEVCTRVVTGVETVTEEIPDPDYIAAAPTITHTREVETVTWECGPVLAPRASEKADV